MSCNSDRIVRVTYPKNCCPEVDDSQQLLYNGPALACIDVQTNQSLNDAIKEIDQLICQTLNSLTTTTTSSTSTTTSTTTCSVCCEAICGETYEGCGYLYNWFAIFGAGAQTNGGRNVGGIVNTTQPFGDERNQWRVPSDEDWTELTTYLGGLSVAGGKLKTTCTAPFTTNNGLWESPNTDATNEVNWSGVPGGNRNYLGTFNPIGSFAYWWSSTESSTGFAWARTLSYNNGDVYRFNDFKTDGFTVRLVRPATITEQALPDGTTSNDNPSLPHYIGNSRTYITVKIGNQVWTAQNLIDTTYNNGTLIPEVTDPLDWSVLTTGARCSYNNGSITPDQGQIELCGVPN